MVRIVHLVQVSVCKPIARIAAQVAVWSLWNVCVSDGNDFNVEVCTDWGHWVPDGCTILLLESRSIALEEQFFKTKTQELHSLKSGNVM